MSETAIFETALAAVKLAIPNAKDWSDDPSDPRPDKLDAFVLEITRDGATPAAMGSDLEEVQLTVQVEVFTKYLPADDGRAKVKAMAEAIRGEVMSFAPLSALLDRPPICQTLNVDLSKGETRLALATVTFAVEATI